MFSPAVNQASQVPSASIRSSRRRARPLSNEGSILQPKAKRQRSALSGETFLPPNTNGQLEMEEAKSQKVAVLPNKPKQMSVRSKKARSGGERSGKGDGSVVLTTNDTYTVSKLPALPDRLRTDSTTRQHGVICSENGYALAFTHSHAIIWPYADNASSPADSKTHVLQLPHPSQHSSGLLPLGCLVNPSEGGMEPGLVVVMPNSGRITYWEAVGNADTLQFIPQRKLGVEFTIPHLGSDAVTQVLNAESAGFILAFRSGKLAYMNVKDGQGRPAITMQYFLGGGSKGGGIFGSIRGFSFGSSQQETIAAVRAGPPRPDKVTERDIVMATAKGKIQSWNVQRGGFSSLLAEIEGREAIVTAMKHSQPALLSSLLLETFEILDFAYAPKPSTESQLIGQQAQSDVGVHLLLLASLGSPQTTHYSLVEVCLNHDDFTVGIIRPIKSYTTPVNIAATSRPRLYLPNPALVAYAVFDRAVVVISMAKQPESPDSQLRAENHILPKTFEDVVDFRGDMNVEIVGSGMEEPHGPQFGKIKHPATVLLVRGGGVIRVAATNILKLTSSGAQQVNAKSKLEQAVFFGTLESNPLSFKGRPELEFPPDEVGSAALELSHEILTSQTPYIPSVSASIDANLQKRAAALRHLAEHLEITGAILDRITRWQLLWNAEKMEAASLIWKNYDASVRTNPRGQRRGLMADVIDYINESYKSNPIAEVGELDPVRHWFIHDISGMAIAIPWAFQVVKYCYQDGQNQHDFILSSLSEADDIVISALEGAFKFRAANLVLYGLQDETLENGILTANYEGLPEFWTSTSDIVKNTSRQAQLAGALLSQYCSPNQALNKALADPAVPQKVRREYSRLVDLVIRSGTERLRWTSAQDSPQIQLELEELQASQTKMYDNHIIVLSELDLPDQAVALAEKHRLMPTLAALIMMQIRFHGLNARQLRFTETEYKAQTPALVALESRIGYYFEKFGSSWATAFYEHNIELKAMANLLEAYQDQRAYLTPFLRSKPEYAKLSWLHEVIREQDFGRAAETLLDLGLNREKDLWSKKIELSLGKLARLATARPYSEANGILIPDGGEAELADARTRLSLVSIQDQVYAHVLPTIEDAVDENAELSLAFEYYISKALKAKTGFLALLEDSLTRLVKHEAMDALALIDLLTLIGGDRVSDDDWEFQSHQFYLALQTLRHGVSDNDELDMVQRVIWRRCMLKDNWIQVNDTNEKHDEQLSQQLRNTTLYMTYKACYKNRVFETNSLIKPVMPKDVLGAGTDELDHRFERMDASMKERLMKNMQAEGNSLQPYLEKARLDKWAQTALDLAKDDFMKDVDEETDDGQSMRLAALKLQDFEEKIAKDEKEAADKALHSKGRPKRKPKVDGNFRGSQYRG